jgi:hypothetical protein
MYSASRQMERSMKNLHSVEGTTVPEGGSKFEHKQLSSDMF